MADFHALTRRQALAAGAFGSLPARRPDQLAGPPAPGLLPAPQPQVIRARQVIIGSTSGVVGLFEYSGAPGPGNIPVAWAVPPGVTTDPFGNALPASDGGFATLGPGGFVTEISDGAIALFQQADGTRANISGGQGAVTVLSGLIAAGTQAQLAVLSSAASSNGLARCWLVGQAVVGGANPVTAAALEVEGSAAVNGIDAIVSGALETWHSVAPSHAGFGGSINYKKVAQTGEVMVALRANAAASTTITSGDTIGTLPAGYRPATDNEPLVTTYSPFGGITSLQPLNVSTAGVITWTGPTTTTPAGGFSFIYSVPAQIPTDL